MDKKFEIAKELYTEINLAISNFKHHMIELIGEGELPLRDLYGAYDDAVQAEIVNKHGETCEVAIDKVRYENCVFYFHVIYINDEEADEWVYDGAFTDDVCDLLATAIPEDEEDE